MKCSSLYNRVITSMLKRLELNSVKEIMDYGNRMTSLFFVIYGTLFNTYILVDTIVRNRSLEVYGWRILVVYLYTFAAFILNKAVKNKRIKYFVTNVYGPILLILLTLFFYEVMNLVIWTILFIIMIIAIVQIQSEMLIYVIITGLAVDIYLFFAYSNISIVVKNYFYVAHFMLHLILGIVAVIANTILKNNITRNIKLYKSEHEINEKISSLYEELLAGENVLRIKNQQILAYNEQIRENEKRLYELAYYDTLTKLPNRKYFMDKIVEVTNVNKEKETKVSVVMIDIDNFKLINDSLGHVAGDQFLHKIATRFNEAAGSNLISRIGGDEFAVIIYDENDKDRVAETVQLFLDCFTEPFIIGGETLYSGASFGVARYPMDSINTVELINCADIAMYESKKSGKMQVHFYDTEMGKRFSEQN